jgi:hypothetical protein
MRVTDVDIDCKVFRQSAFSTLGRCECGYSEGFHTASARQVNAANPKTLMGRRKVPMLSVIPPASLIYEAEAMNYGAFEAVRADGSKGYGPFNWRDQPIEAGVYVDACIRHLLQWWDGEECADDSGVHHLGHAKATLGILIDAIENDTWIDTRPKVKKMRASKMLKERQKT